MASAEDLQHLRSYLVSYGGGYLRNTLWDSRRTCSYCAGVPANPQFTTCYPCGKVYPWVEASDARGFVSYGWDRSQSARVMYGYKDATPNWQARRLVQILLYYALHEHLRCASHPQHGEPNSWAVVPSLRGRTHAQVLHQLASSLLRDTPEIQMSPSSQVVDPRTFRPENFAVLSNVGSRHVVLIDDTWTSGSHAESAAAALKRAGADRVTVLVLARWLDLSRGDTDEFVRSELTRDFDPDLCPFGQPCHEPV